MKLNLGAGSQPLPGYFNIDRSYTEQATARFMYVYAPEVPIKAQGEVFPLAYFPDDSCEVVRASHILEHFPHGQIMDVLAEWVRVLKPGGWLKIAVPDFAWIATQYLAGAEINTLGYVMGGQIDENDFHKTIFDEEFLSDCLTELGLVNVQRWQSEIEDCAALPVSLNLMAQKPDPKERPEQPDLDTIVKRAREVWELPTPDTRHPTPVPTSIPRGEVIAIMSLPRLAFTENMFCCLQGLGSLGLRVLKSGGVFWGQCLEEMIEVAIADGAKYVLTLDYDTLFTAKDVLRLYGLAEQYEADAIVPVQTRREKDSPLFTVDKGTGNVAQITSEELDTDLYPIASGHFGLTLLRTSVLKTMQRPLFHSKPDPAYMEGAPAWGEGRMDEDVHFWHRLKFLTKKIYLAPHIVVGHLQLLATWPDTDLQARHQYLSAFHQDGKPDWAWE